MKFKVGDRVNVYGREWSGPNGFKSISGTVTEVHPSALTVDTKEMIYVCHPKQCRRLKPKKRREFWINPIRARPFVGIGFNGDVYEALPEGVKFDELIHVREVRNDGHRAQKATT